MLSNITIHITTFCISKFQMESGIKSMVHCGNSNIKTMEKKQKTNTKTSGSVSRPNYAQFYTRFHRTTHFEKHVFLKKLTLFFSTT